MPLRTVICLLTGSKYHEHYVTRLQSMVSRHLSGHRFVCLSDRQIDGVECIVRDDIPEGWWGKVMMFSGDLDIEYPALYLDIDVLIVGELDELASDELTAIRQTKNIKSPKTVPLVNSSAMLIPHAGPWDIWTEFGGDVQDKFRGDQDWIGHLHPEIKTWPSEWFEYMENCPERAPKACKVVVCNVVENDAAIQKYMWTRDVWR